MVTVNADGTFPRERDARDQEVPTAAAAAFLAGGGAEQTVSLLGPYAITIDTPGLLETGGSATALKDGGYVDLAAIPDGAVVITAFAIIGTDFNGSGAGNQFLEVGIQPADDPDNNVSLQKWKAVNNSNAPATYAQSVDTTASPSTVTLAISAAHLYVLYDPGPGGSTPTAGAADVYALIATPA